MKEETVGIIEITIASLLFGCIPLLVRWGSSLGPYNLSAFRVLVAAVSIYLFIAASRSRIAPFEKERGRLLVFGAIHGFIILGYFLAIQYLSVASAILLLYSAAIWIVIFAHFLLRERITGKTLMSLFIAFTGVIIVVSPTSFFIRESLIGSVAGLLAGVGFGLVYVLSKTFKTYDKVSLTFWQNLIALPFVLPLLFIAPPAFTGKDVAIILLLGTLCTALPFVLVFRGLAKVSAQKGGVLILLDILFPILLAAVVLGELPGWSVALGGLLIVIGFYLVTAERKSVVNRKKMNRRS